MLLQAFALFISLFICPSIWTIENSPYLHIFKTIPKAELHLHLSGAYPLKYLLSIASPEDAQQLQYQLNQVSQGMPYKKVLSIFSIVTRIVNSNSKVKWGTYSLCRSLREDGVTYAEIRTGLKDFGSGYEQYLRAVLDGIKKAQTDDFKAKLLISLQRSSSRSMAQHVVDLALKYKQEGVVGIDLSGDSLTGEVENIVPELLRAKKNGLFLTVHMGETLFEQDQERILTALCPNRIGHGVFLSSRAVEWIKKHRIPVEVCLTSSLLVEMTKEYGAHPWIHRSLSGYPIIIGTDDPLIFQTSLSNEYRILHEKCGFSMAEIQTLAQRGFQYAFGREGNE